MAEIYRRWLSINNKRLKEKTDIKNNVFPRTDLDNLKRRYPIMFWPELLIKDIVKNKKIKNKKKIIEALEIISEKPSLYRRIENEIKKVHGL